jgi:hypothetical protein
MAKRRVDNIEQSDDEPFLPVDKADQAFWDEFWRQEYTRNEQAPLVTITITNEETGEERVIENVRLRFKNAVKMRE